MKANLFTFVRGLKNGTPPRFQSYLKSLTLLLGLALSSNVWGENYTGSLEITISNFTEITASYTTKFTHEYTINKSATETQKCTIEAYGVYKNSNGIQMNSGKGTYIKNTSAFPGYITSIECTWTATGKNSPTLYVNKGSVASTSSTSLGKGSNTITTQTYTVTNASTSECNYFYFDGTTVTGACYLSKLKINYSVGAADPVTTLYLSKAGTLSDNLKGTYKVGDKYPLPDEVTAECGGKTFVGWSTETVDSPTEPTSNFYEPGAKVTLAANNIFYAVFADEAEGDVSTTFTFNGEILGTGGYKDADFEWGGIDFKRSQMYYNNGGAQIKASNYGFWNSEAFPGAIKQIKVTATQNDATLYVGASAKATTSSNSISKGAERTIDFSTSNNYKYLYIKSGSSYTVITTLTVTYVGTSYSNYTTTCAPTYEATVADGITNGSVVISKTDDAMAGAASLTGLKQGEMVYIFPTANTGYKLDAVTVNGTPITDTEGKYIYTIAEEGITVSATFVPATYQITYNLDGGEWTGAAGVATYTYGTGATLPTADDITKANNTFLGWFLNNEGDVATTVIGTTETGDKSFTARWLASGAKNVTISGDDKLTYTTFKPTTVNKDAENLTIDYSIEKGYTISAVAVTVNDAALTEEGEVVFNDEQLTITPNDGFTGNVSITFTVVEKMFTVTWMANKTQFKQEQIQEGNKVTLPATNPVDVISGEDTYKFQGWFTEEQYSNETTAPAYITNNTIEPTGDVTYYAVYAIEEKTPSTTTYTRVTEEAQLQTASSLVIVNNSASKLFTNALGTATAPTESNGEITVNNTDMWSLSYANSKYTISNASGTLGAATMPAKSSGNYNKPMSITTSNNSWTIAESGTDLFVLKNADNVGIEYYSSNWVVYINNDIAGVEACAHKLYIPKMINTYKNYRTRVAIIDHIAVNGTPAETNFVAGETFNATGLTIDVYYKDEDAPTNVTEGFTYAPMGALKTTDENITFSYQGKQVLLPISVSNTVSGIEVTTNPSKMEYTEGEQFNPTGMEVTATYDNGAKRVVTGYTYTPTGDLALGNKITISFGGQTTELGITINEATKTTVNWYVNGVKLTEGEQSTAVIPGKKVTVLPLEPEACQGNQFVGWTTQETYYNATTAPANMFKTLADAPTIGETETNFYAVFASEAVGTYDEKVTLTALDAPTADKFTYAFANPSGTKPSWVASASEARAYVNNTLTVTSKNSRIITKIEYTYNINKNDKGTAPSGATVTGNNSDNGSWDATNKTWTSSTNAATTVTLTVNGSAGNYGFTAIKVYLTGGTVLSDYSTTCLAALAAPTIITAEGEYCGSVDVEITQPAGNPEGAKIMYSTDNTNWNEYEAAVNITSSGTIYAKVVKNPKQTEVVSATYTIYPAYTLAEAATAASATSQMACLTFTDLLVQARSQGEAFLKASDGQIVLLSKSSHGLQVGDKLSASDAHVTFVKAHDLLQLTSTEGIAAATTGNATTPEEKAITALAAADYGKLVKIMNVTYDATNKKFTDASSNEIAVDAKFFIGGSLPSSWPDGGKFNATGIVLTNSDKVVIAPRNTDDLESLATPLDKPTNFAVASVNSYRASYSWTAVDNNNGYTLYIYDGDNEIYKSNKIGSTIETYAPQKDLEAGHTYTAKLVALGDKAISSDSPAAEVEFTTNPNAKLNWYVGDDEEPYATTYASQEKVVTPEDPESPCATNYENFVTWYTEEIDGQITALEASKKVKAGDAAASATTEQVYNFYAVFGKVKTPGTDKYVAVTSEPTKWEGEYLIVHNDSVFNGSQTTLDAEKNGVVLTREEDGSYLASNANNYRFVIAKSTTKDEDDETAVYYTIQSASEYFIGGKNNDNGMNSNQKFATQTYDNILSWSEDKVKISSYYGNTYLTFNTVSNQLRFRYMKSDYKNLVLYKRTKTNPTYNGYITTCPQTYTITIAENTKGLVEAATTTEILKGAKVLLTATANAGYTKTGGNWIVKNTTTGDVVDGLVGNNNYLTMPDYNVTVDYNFIAKTDNFVDNLHNNEAKTAQGGGTEYVIPNLESETEGTSCDAYYMFEGWVTEQIFSDAPAQNDDMKVNPTYAEGKTYYALWMGDNGYITDCCNTSIPENLKALSTYLKATSAKLDWDNVADATKYHIIVKQGETTLYDTDVEKSEFEISSGLTKETIYDVYVKAYAGCWSENAHIQFTTAAEIKSYSVTINAEGGTYELLADPEMEGNKIQEGAYVVIGSIAVTNPDHYFFKELTIEPEVSDLEESEGTYSFTMPSKAITINIVFAEYPKVTWKMEGAADQTSIAERDGDKFVIGADNMQSAADWKYKTYFLEFAGWVTADKCDAEGNVTTAEFITAATEVPATGLTVYGAVAKSAMPDFDNLEKITTTIDESAKYLIGAEQSSSDNTMWYFNDVVDSQWGRMAKADATENKAHLMTVIGTASAFTIQDQDGQYLAGATSKFSAMSETASTFSLNDSEIEYKPSSTYKLRHNYNNGNGGLRWYDGSTGTPAYLYKVGLTYENLTINPQPDHIRTGLTYDKAGTICLPYAVKADDYKGASVWSIESRVGSGDMIYAITLVQEVDEGGNKKDLEAGKPYIFFAEESEFQLFYSGNEYTDNESVWANGLIGNLNVDDIVINAGGYQPGSYLINQNKLMECGANCYVGQYRAYVKASEIGAEQPTQAPIMAPRRVIGNPNVAPTRIDNLSEDAWLNLNGAHKFFLDGNIVIMNEGKLYNAQGIRVQ